MYLNETLYFYKQNHNSHFKTFHYWEILNYNITTENMSSMSRN